MTKRKKYSKEFKLDAISLVKEQGYNQAEAARNLGLNPNMLGRWIKESESDDGQAFRGNGKLTPNSWSFVNYEKKISALKWSAIY
jgi:transposase